MKKSLRLICLAFVFVFICAGIGLMHIFPVDTQAFVEKKYAGWNGVLQAWVCTNWNPNGSFISWLNHCASGFEKNHEGVYLEFIPVQAKAMHEISASGSPLPDLVFFSPGVILNPDILNPLQACDSVRNDLQYYGQGVAEPVALSGYIWACNTALCDDVPRTANAFIDPILLESVTDRYHCAALLGLLSETEGIDNTQYLPPDAGIDLGLPASAGSKSSSGNAFDMFIDGSLACVPVEARELGRLIRLKDSGKGPDWQTSPSGEIACTDQILMAGIPKRPDHLEHDALAREFITFLLSADAQAALADIGAFSVTGDRIHSDFSVYAEMDALLNSRFLWLPDCFSEYSLPNPEAIVRRFLQGEISAKFALGLLGFEGM